MYLQTLEAAAAVCECCDLHKNRIKPVFAKGNPEADLMICGMVPGPDENEAGSPFVGRAGKLLDVILDKVDLTLDDVYITNTVKCALKPGISLTEGWISSCLAFLLAQIAFVNPKAIITLGADATNALLGLPLDTKIGFMRGKVQPYYYMHVIPTYHPSYLLRGGGEKHKYFNRVIEDFELAVIISNDENIG